MQTMPSPVKSTSKHTQSESGKVSRRRLFSLLATAIAASSLGIALGSTLRFQVVPGSQASLFKPQQDFPPLEEWPPEVPTTGTDKFDTNWDHEIPPSQLVYNDHHNAPPYTEVENAENYDSSENFYDDGQDIRKETLVPEAPPSSTSAIFRHADGTITDEVSDEEISPPMVSTISGESDSDGSKTPQLDDNNVSPASETPHWFNKQPLSDSQFSDSQFTNGPVISSPEISIPPYDLPSD